jgi:ABC-type multidrug transport system fused ATPase/permease subunit
MGCVAALLLTFGIYDTPFSFLATPGTAGVVLAYLSILSQQAPMVIFMTAKLEQAMTGCQRIVEYKDAPTEDTMQIVKEAVDPAWPAKGVLSLQEVQMRYRTGLPLALDGVSLSVKPREKVGIVGRTGSGKSSIILTCFRMVECAGGKVLVDDNDISKVPVGDLRTRLGVIPQDSWLFSGTVRSNIDVTGERTDEELWAAIQHVQLESQIKSFEDGLDHEVKEKGENLSAGTAQLLCLARVLLKQPKLLFMDEATASVDSETDLLVQATIRKEGVLPPDCSIVTVAHRLNTVIDYDRIIVMGTGKVLEEGHPHVLLEKEDSHFAALVRDTGEASAKELKRRAQAAFDDSIASI